MALSEEGGRKERGGMEVTQQRRTHSDTMSGWIEIVCWLHKIPIVLCLSNSIQITLSRHRLRKPLCGDVQWDPGCELLADLCGRLIDDVLADVVRRVRKIVFHT